jgi:hypothetical protein
MEDIKNMPDSYKTVTQNENVRERFCGTLKREFEWVNPFEGDKSFEIFRETFYKPFLQRA